MLDAGEEQLLLLCANCAIFRAKKARACAELREVVFGVARSCRYRAVCRLGEEQRAMERWDVGEKGAEEISAASLL